MILFTAYSAQCRYRNGLCVDSHLFNTINPTNIFGKSYDVVNGDIDDGRVMDDEGRIRIIQQTLKEARSVYRAMRATIRRANRATYKLQRQKRELEVFNRLFGKTD